MAAFFLIVARLVAKSHGLKPAVGREALIGEIGRAKTALEPTGMVWVGSALWEATAEDGPIPVGARVEVVALDGLRLTVRHAVDTVGDQPPDERRSKAGGTVPTSVGAPS
jgi:membrane-bound serine protease (ClpP class)